MKPTALENLQEWFSELKLWKKIIFAIPFAILITIVAMWLLAKTCSGNGDLSPMRKATDASLKKYDEKNEVYKKMVDAVQNEVGRLHKKGEIDDREFQKLKIDLHEAGTDISRVNAILARARKRRSERNRGADR